MKIISFITEQLNGNNIDGNKNNTDIKNKYTKISWKRKSKYSGYLSILN